MKTDINLKQKLTAKRLSFGFLTGCEEKIGLNKHLHFKSITSMPSYYTVTGYTISMAHQGA